MRKKIYIAGKVTGEDIVGVTLKFVRAYEALRDKGYEVVNPILIVNDFDTPWDVAMRICIAALMQCDEAYFLRDWKDSKGAKIEHQLCIDTGIPIHYELT